MVLLELLDYEAVMWPNGKIYMLESQLRNPWLRRHEFAHLKQWRESPWTFWPRLYWQYARYGHDKAPYEQGADHYATSRLVRSSLVWSAGGVPGRFVRSVQS